jgi:hypothetical protein
MNRPRTLSIEVVENGWIVRPFNAGDWACGCAVREPIHVFTTMHDLQLALPHLIDRPPSMLWRHIPDEKDK